MVAASSHELVSFMFRSNVDRRQGSADARADARAPSGLARRPRGVRCFGVVAPGRPRRSSEAERRGAGNWPVPAALRPGCGARRADLSRRRTPRRGCTCPRHPHGRGWICRSPQDARWGLPQRGGRAPRPMHGVHARSPAGLEPAPARRASSTAWQAPARPGRGAAGQAAAGARREAVSRGVRRWGRWFSRDVHAGDRPLGAS